MARDPKPRKRRPEVGPVEPLPPEHFDLPAPTKEERIAYLKSQGRWVDHPESTARQSDALPPQSKAQPTEPGSQRGRLPPELEQKLRGEFAAEDSIKAAQPMPDPQPPLFRLLKTQEQRLADLQADRDALLSENVDLKAVVRRLIAENDALRKNSRTGGLAKRKYTEDDYSRWKEIAAKPAYKRLSKLERAKRIRTAEKLPPTAVATIRKHI